MFAFLLNYPWEFLQTPFYQGMGSVPHWVAVKACSLASLFDAGLTLLAFLTASLIAGGTRWFWHPETRNLAWFVGVGLACTIALEWIGQEMQWSQYSDLMPIVPIMGVGLVPIIQWLLLPPMVLKIARHQARRSG